MTKHLLALLLTAGTLVDLGTLGGTNGFAAASRINNRGQVAGMAPTAGEQIHAFLWEHGAMTDLGTLGGPTSRVIALADNGFVVGTSQTDDGFTHAFPWRR